MKKPAIFFLVILSLSCSKSWSQRVTSTKIILKDSLAGVVDINSTALPYFNTPEDAETIVSGIMNAMGLSSDVTVKASGVPNVEATMHHHERYILYNPVFVSQVNSATKSKWANIFILAHELGHHLLGHTANEVKGGPQIELQADQFAGFVLRKMGASLYQAQLAMHFISSTQASKSHPGRADRLASIQKGWNKAAQASSTFTPTDQTVKGNSGAQN